MPASNAHYADNLLQSLTRLFDGDADNNCHQQPPGDSINPARIAQSGANSQYQQPNGSGSEFASRERKAVPQHESDNAPADKTDSKQLLEKIKQRNREKQARHRARIKKELQEVESKVNIAQGNLQHARMRHRRLELQASALKTRADEATEALAVDVQAAAKLAEQAPPPVVAQPKSSEPEQSMQVALSTAYKRRRNEEKSAKPVPISSFKACEAISCASIAPYMATAPNSCAQGFNLVQQAMNEYQRVMSSKRSLLPQDVCWFIQFPYSIVPDLRMSYSSGYNTPECCVTVSLCISIASVECMFLALELEAHEAASSPGSIPPAHPFVEKCTKLLEAEHKGLLASSGAAAGVPAEVLEIMASPPAPEPELLAKGVVQLHACAGVNNRFPIESAIQETLGRVCREHRAQIPRDLWRAVIMRAKLVVATSICRLQKASRAAQKPAPAKQGSGTSETPPPDSTAAAQEPEGISWANMDAATLAVLQLRLQTYHRVLHERVPTNQSVPQKGVKEIQARIYELFVTVGLGTAAGFKANPNLMRTIIMQQHFGHFQDFVKLERENMKVIKYLDITPDQKPALADKWYQWHSRRTALDKTLTDALTSFDESLPSAQNVPRSLIAALEMFDDGDPNGIDLERLRRRLVPCGSGNGSLGEDPEPLGPGTFTANEGNEDTQSIEETECVSRPCVAINPCDPGSSLTAAEAHYGTEQEGFGCSATSVMSSRSRSRSTSKKFTNAKPKSKRPSSWESNDSVFRPSSINGRGAAPTGSTGAGASLGRRRSISLQPSPRSTPRSGSMSPSVQHAHSGLQHTLTSTVTTTPSGLRQFVENPAVTSSCTSEDLKLPGKTKTLLQRTASAAARTAQYAQSVISEQEATDTEWMFNSLQSGNSSHDGTVDMPDMLARLEDDWWKPENRAAFVGESMKKLMDAEQALDTLMSVHETDNLMSQEMMLPAWELTPMQHARIFSSHIELATAKLDAIRVFRSAAYDLRREELFAGL